MLAQMAGRMAGGKPGAAVAGGAAQLVVRNRQRSRLSVQVDAAHVAEPTPARLVDRLRGTSRSSGASVTAGERYLLIRWCDLCQLERRRTPATYQAELPFTAELCGSCLRSVWREAPEAIVVARPLSGGLSQRPAQPANDALLLRLFRSGVRVPGLTGLVPV